MPHAENCDCLRGNGLNNGFFKSGHKGLFRNAELSGQPKSEREIIFTRKGPIGNSLMGPLGIVRWREIDTLTRSHEFLSCFQTKGDGGVTGREAITGKPFDNMPVGHIQIRRGKQVNLGQIGETNRLLRCKLVPFRHSDKEAPLHQGREFEHRRIGPTRNQRHIHCPALQRLQTSITRQLEQPQIRIVVGGTEPSQGRQGETGAAFPQACGGVGKSGRMARALMPLEGKPLSFPHGFQNALALRQKAGAEVGQLDTLTPAME